MEIKFMNKVVQALRELKKIVVKTDRHLADEISRILKYLERPDEQHPLGMILREALKLTDEKGILDKLAKDEINLTNSNKHKLINLRINIYKTAYCILTTPSAEELEMERELKNIAEITKKYITKEEYSQICEYIDYDEWVLALENICAVIRDEKILISIEIYNSIIKFGSKMKMGKVMWEEIKSLVVQ